MESLASADGNSGSVPETINYSVAVQNTGGGNTYFLDGVQQKGLNLVQGNTYVFDTPANHPLRFSSAPDGTHGGGTEYTEGVTYSPSGQVMITVT